MFFPLVLQRSALQYSFLVFWTILCYLPEKTLAGEQVICWTALPSAVVSFSMFHWKQLHLKVKIIISGLWLHHSEGS